MRLLADAEPDVGVHLQPVVQVRGAALGLPDDVEVGQAAHAVQPAVPVKQVFPKRVPQELEHGAEALGELVLVAPVRVRRGVPRVFLVPARVLEAGQELAWDNGKHLQRRKTKRTINPPPHAVLWSQLFWFFPDQRLDPEEALT